MGPGLPSPACPGNPPASAGPGAGAGGLRTGRPGAWGGCWGLPSLHGSPLLTTQTLWQVKTGGKGGPLSEGPPCHCDRPFSAGAPSYPPALPAGPWELYLKQSPSQVSPHLPSLRRSPATLHPLHLHQLCPLQGPHLSRCPPTALSRPLLGQLTPAYAPSLPGAAPALGASPELLWSSLCPTPSSWVSSWPLRSSLPFV